MIVRGLRGQLDHEALLNGTAAAGERRHRETKGRGRRQRRQ
jgi:hypothetical protein